MIVCRRVGRENWWDTGDEVCENPDFNAALKDAELNIERGDFIGQTLV